MARDLVKRNVVELTEVPAGQPGRSSKSLTARAGRRRADQDSTDRLHAYIVVSLLTGARTEELRALRWDHVHLDDPVRAAAHRGLAVGAGSRRHQDQEVPTDPGPAGLCVEALRKQRAQQAQDRLAAGERWQETGLVFTTPARTEMDAANVRRDFRRALALVPGLDPAEWTPRELRHSFVSLLSDAGVPLEEISQPRRSQRNDGHRAGLPAPDPAGDSDRRDGHGPVVRPAKLRCVVTQLVTHQGSVRAAGGVKWPLTWVGTAGLEPATPCL